MSQSSGLSRYKFEISLAVLLLSSLLLKLFFATKYVTYTDEILSAEVAQSIWRTGLPWLPSGGLYTRAYLHHYLLSIPVGLFGVEYLPMRINSILFSLVILLSLYRFGTQTGSRGVAIVIVALVSFSTVLNQAALTGRMYITYVAFLVLSFLFFHEGFILGKPFRKGLAFACMAATMLCSEAGALVGPIFGLMLLLHSRLSWMRDRTVWIGFGVWFAMYYLLRIYEVPGKFTGFTAHSGIKPPKFLHLGMSPRELLAAVTWPWRALDRALPFTVPLFLILGFRAIRKPDWKRHFPLFVLVPQLLLGSLFTPYRVQHRIILGWVPLYVLSLCLLVWWYLESERGTHSLAGIGRRLREAGRGAVAAALIYVVLAGGILVTNGVRGPADLGRYVTGAFGYQDKRGGYNLEPSFDYLRAQLQPGDKIVATTMEYPLFFLGEEGDYFFLRQRQVPGEEPERYVPFDEEREPYYGRPLIDSPDELDGLLQSGSTVWLVTDYKYERYRHVGAEIERMIDQEFELVFDDRERNKARVYRRM